MTHQSYICLLYTSAARDILGKVVMDGVAIKPVPEVTASALEVGAEGGDVYKRQA